MFYAEYKGKKYWNADLFPDLLFLGRTKVSAFADGDGVDRVVFSTQNRAVQKKSKKKEKKIRINYQENEYNNRIIEVNITDYEAKKKITN